MKKKLAIVFVFVLVVLLASCGKPESSSNAVPDMQAVYDSISKSIDLPGMILLSGDRRFDLLGIDPTDCTQAVTAICGDSVRADEIWLIEAVDSDAGNRIFEMAQIRIEEKLQQLENYLPDQYEIVKNSTLLRENNTIALFISPDADKMIELLHKGT